MEVKSPLTRNGLIGNHVMFKLFNGLNHKTWILFEIQNPQLVEDMKLSD